MNSPITQSKNWQVLQDELGETSFFEKTAEYHYLATLVSRPTGKYLYLPYGPVYKGKTGFKKALKSLTNLAKKQGAIFVRVEPQDPDFASYAPKNAKKVKDLSPKDTWQLDLTPDRQSLIFGFSHGTRNLFNTFSKRGLSVESTKDLSEIKHLVRLQNELFKEKKLNTFSEKYLKAELSQPFASLYLVRYQHPEGKEKDEFTPKDGQVLAASLFFDYDGKRYYMQSASDPKYKKLPATIAILGSAIFDAKEKGIKRFDFWGIAPEGAPKNHPWKGFTKFKQSFGGEPVSYAGTYDIILNPVKYRLYQIFRKINRLIRHI